MARKHVWFYLKDEEGVPIEGAQINLYLLDTTTEATVYNSRTASGAIDQSTILSNVNGYFEFYIGDQFEELPNIGYGPDQIFELHWTSADGTGYVDNFQIFHKVYPVDETNSINTNADKMVSNELAYKWGIHVGRLYDTEPHSILPVDETDSSDGTVNKVVSNEVLYRLYNEPLASGGFTIETSGALFTTHYLYPSADQPSGSNVARDFDPELERSALYPLVQVWEVATGDQIQPVDIKWIDSNLVRVVIVSGTGILAVTSVGEIGS